MSNKWRTHLDKRFARLFWAIMRLSQQLSQIFCWFLLYKQKNYVFKKTHKVKLRCTWFNLGSYFHALCRLLSFRIHFAHFTRGNNYHPINKSRIFNQNQLWYANVADRWEFQLCSPSESVYSLNSRDTQKFIANKLLMLSCAVCWGAEARPRVSLPFHLQPQDEPKPQPGAQLLSAVSNFKTNPTQRHHRGERRQGASEYVIWPCVAAFKIQWSILHFSRELLNVINCRSVLFNYV